MASIQLSEFELLFGPKGTPVDCSNPPRDTGRPPSLPTETSTPEPTANKLQPHAPITEQRTILTTSTPCSTAASNLAQQSMTPPELDCYLFWKQGHAQIPPFDFAANKEPLVSEKNRKRHEKRARTMNKIWGVDNATAENAMFVSLHMVAAMPLIKAVAREEGAELVLAAAGRKHKRGTDYIMSRRPGIHGLFARGAF
ncbi:hypothetical protein CONLIGDRAFT_649807 [Coniochaeta ligniaria NRRL 30616]|uniref:Uncharacterized protein n=1 Tax=Coniochaeta ligniaria NRRL 30616 TaxID=1408157 RepID=A0A1J7I6M2_9PEZI|nr:hypothetical protein CONLIGDRAFT_649807 [Coniochaeta ligniaria NRRL 30616]